MIDIVPPNYLGQIVIMVEDGTISKTVAKKLIGYYIAIGKLKRGIKPDKNDIEDLKWVLETEKS